MDKPKRGAVPVAVAAVGIIGLAHLTREPSFAAIRTVDFVQILGSGACFGVALMAIIARSRGSGQ
jgi:cyanate permease